MIQLPTNRIRYDIEGVRRQYSGNGGGGIVKGIGIVTCIYYNAAADRFWVIDYRIFDPERDGKTKLDHVAEMLDSIERGQIWFRTVLMNSWYPTTALMSRLIGAEKFFYCPIKKTAKLMKPAAQNHIGQSKLLLGLPPKNKRAKRANCAALPERPV